MCGCSLRHRQRRMRPEVQPGSSIVFKTKMWAVPCVLGLARAGTSSIAMAVRSTSRALRPGNYFRFCCHASNQSVRETKDITDPFKRLK